MTHWQLARWIEAWAIEELGPDCGITAKALKEGFSRDLLYSDWVRCNADHTYIPVSIRSLRRGQARSQPAVVVDRMRLAANDRD